MTQALPAAVAFLVNEAAARHGLAPQLVQAVAWTESHGEQSAVSPVGALGVMQLMPDTARGLGVDPRDLAENIDGGTRLLASLVSEFGERNALAAYNWGQGKTTSAHRAKLIAGDWPAETRKYVAAVLARAAGEVAPVDPLGNLAARPSSLSWL